MPTEHNEHNKPLTRQERNELRTKRVKRKKVRKAEQQPAKSQKEKKPKKYRKRIFPIWLRIIVVLILASAAAVLGAMVGYGVIGNGDPMDVLKSSTWQHIVDIVNKTK